MEFLQKAPPWITNNVPDGVKSFLEGPGWYAVLGVGGLLALLIVWVIARKIGSALFGGPRKEVMGELTEDLTEIPAPPALTGDRRLTVEGVPVRLRLVVVAPAGRAHEVEEAGIPHMLEKVMPGLGKFIKEDKPELRVWPLQLSYEGFANTFHKNTPVPEGEGEPSRWVLVAGRAQMDKQQFMLALALQAIKPTTVGRLRLDKHEWTTTLRIKTRD